jgi:hypothetical protein
MKKLLLAVTFFVSSIFFYAIPETNSYFVSSVKLTENIFESAILLNFYPRSDNHAVGFEIKGISDYEALEYKVRYTHDGIIEVVHSTLTLSGQDAFKEEWIILGSCSEGGVCVYFDDVTDIKLTVNLKDTDASGVTTLNKDLSL